MFHQPVFKKVASAGLNSLQQKWYQILVKQWIFDDPCHKKGPLLVILVPFLSEAVEASRCYFFENWLMKHKWVALVTMQPEIYHQNYQSFYPLEPFTLDHSAMRHPVTRFLPQGSKMGQMNMIKALHSTKCPIICVMVRLNISDVPNQF